MALTSSATGTSYTDRTAVENVTYYYTVRALSGSMISASFDETKSIKRMSSLANVKLGGFKNTKDGIVINWEEVEGADTYRIYRRTVNGNWMALTSSATGTSYTDRTAVENVTYYYTVRALSGSMISASFDETKSIKRMSSLANVKLGGFKNTKDGIVINWEEVEGADTYRIYRRTVNGNWMALTSSATGTSYTDRTAVENVTYYYTVRALRADIISPTYDDTKFIKCSR